MEKYTGEIKKIILIPCQAGGYIAYYENRDDIIASGDSADEVVCNLKELYNIFTEYETLEAVNKANKQTVI
jgi:predicted RNase H-like HicB family nuclease